MSNPWGLSIELRQHVGMAASPLGPCEVKFPQWSIMAASRAIEESYGVKCVECGRAGFETRTVEFDAHTNSWPQEAKDWICDEVARLSGVPRRPNSPVIAFAPPPVDLDDEADESAVEDLDE